MGTLKSTHPDYYPVQVLNEVLSGSFTSRLFSSVRTAKGLAYSVGGGVGSNYTRVAPFSMSTSTKTATTAETIETLIAEAKRIIAEPPTAEEIDRAKQSILNSFIFNSATTEQVLGQQVTYEYYGVPTDWLERYRAGIEKVTPADTARVAKQYIKPDQLRDSRRRSHRGPRQAAEHVRRGEDARHLHSGAAVGQPWRLLRSATPGAEDAGRALVEQGRRRHGRRGGGRWRQGVSRGVDRGVPRRRRARSNCSRRLLVAPPDRVRQEMVTPMGAMTMTIAGATRHGAGRPAGVAAVARGAARPDAEADPAVADFPAAASRPGRASRRSRPARARSARRR